MRRSREWKEGVKGGLGFRGFVIEVYSFLYHFHFLTI
jgi:hypothetical protein